MYPQTNLSFVNAVPLALFTASFSASMGMWLYSFITAQSQDAKWRFENIYRPLYEDIHGVVRDLTNYNQAFLGKWRDIKGTSLEPFVAPDIIQDLDSLQARLDRINESHRAARDSAVITLTNLFSLVEVPKLSEQTRIELLQLLQQDSRFLYHPGVELPNEDVITRVRTVLQRSAIGPPDDATKDLLTRVRAALRIDKQIVERARRIEETLPEAQRLHEQILNKLRHPLP